MSLTQIRTESLAAEVTTAIVSAAGLPPKITSIDYPGDDTAADPAGGQTVVIHGANFSASSTIYLNGNQAGVVGYINATALSFTTPAGSPGVVSLYVVNADGGTAIAVPGLLYSGTPSWTTSAGSLGAAYEANSFSVTLQATGDGNVTFAVSAGNTLPSGLTLAANGLLTGTIPATDPTTTYTFYVDAIDSQNQETARTFSVTYTKDTVIWSSPANGAAYSLDVGTANTISLQANSAAGKSITYSVQSGSLPANVTISGANVTGNPNTGQTNTSVVIRATAADTNRYADRTLYFTVNASQPWTISPTASSIANSGTKNLEGGYRGTYSSLYFNPDGNYLFFIDSTNSIINRYAVSPAFSITTLGFPEASYAQTLGLTALYFKTDGTKFYSTSQIGDYIKQFNLNTAWVPNSDTSTFTFDVSARTSVIAGMYFSNDGTKLFINGNDATKAVYRYDLSTPWNLASGVSYTSSYTITSINSLRHIYFKPDGTRMFISGENVTTGLGEIRQYNLSTAWDITTASLVNTLSTASYNNAGVHGMWFSADGEYMIAGYTGSSPYLHKINTNA